MATSTQTAKKDLRKQIKSRLAALSDDEVVNQSQTAQNLILRLPQYEKANRIGIYLSMPTAEARTDILVTHSLEHGKKVFVPYIHRPDGSPRKVIDMLRLSSFHDYEGLRPDSWGIPTLSKDSIEDRENAAGGKGVAEIKEQDEDDSNPGRGDNETLDLIVMPAMAFDQGLNRLGHGGGFYDAFLSRFCKDGSRKPYLSKLRPQFVERDEPSWRC